jgi:hypothetical protein
MIQSLRPFDKLRAGSSDFARALHPDEQRPLIGDPVFGRAVAASSPQPASAKVYSEC